jgi:hypothetical protein
VPLAVATASRSTSLNWISAGVVMGDPLCD